MTLIRALRCATCVAAVLLGGCASYGKPPPLAPDAVLSKDLVAARFNYVVWGEVWQHDLVLTPEVEGALSERVRQSVLALSQKGISTSNVSEGETGWRRFVQELAKERSIQRANTAGDEKVEQPLYLRTLSKFCPFYPIC